MMHAKARALVRPIFCLKSGCSSFVRRSPQLVACSSLARSFHQTRLKLADVDNMHEYTGISLEDWQDYRNQAAMQIGTEEKKRWPLHEKIKAAGPAYVNVAKKVRSSLREIDRVLDVFEPGQLAISFNGSQDCSVVLHLVMEACRHHRSHSFTHVQPIWFKDPEHEFPEIVEYVSTTAEKYFTYQDMLKSAVDENLNRLWTIHVSEPKDFIDGLIYLAQSTGIRCVIMGSRRTDPGCRDLSDLALMDLAPIFLSSSLSRIELETKINMLRVEGDPGLPGTLTSKIKEPSLLRFSPSLEWSFRDVWDFIRAAEIPYCTLYDQGYSSIGTMVDTLRNPALLRREQVQVESSVALKKKLDEIHERMRRNLGKERFEALDKLKLKDQGVAIYDSMYDELEDRERSITSQLISRTMMQNREQDGGAEDLDENEMGGLANQYLLALSKQAEDVDEEAAEDAKPEENIASAPSEKGIVEDQDDPTTMYLPAWKLKDESREVISRVHDQEQGIMGTAAILVIGDEFISAEVRESNSHFISSNLRKIGVAVKQVMIIESDIDIVAFMLRRLSPVYQYIFVVGGMGPRHTDLTLLAVAKSFGTGVQEHPDLLSMIEAGIPAEKFAQVFSEYHWRMAFIPFGAELLVSKYWPVVKKNNVYILPSKPSLLTEKFLSILPQLKSSPLFLTTIIFRVDKSVIAENIANAVSKHETVNANSFTRTMDDGTVRTIVYLEEQEQEEEQHQQEDEDESSS
ncbi:hypothetical protein GUITHDRAFT_115085 [Guillardia theta CCMP2712]|uniref:FAD synthase n=1 Tax=Guillardia theta (strain CCMP2712) TaxID=905079 RepID=L1IRP9_GUITC|nr:hypothetical protein GUITHDRAFT_115085 [Guillardia theta CCMP2712]EKX38757.1 hypothetical protein GUITHDRAFT_115085 [Guillardia theta CCMP2712]|eukprot:XP_005825737.1 hypothetical protein GUITHDRAFT_115085 [Guillardia theta CCMP2712]